MRETIGFYPPACGRRREGRKVGERGEIKGGREEKWKEKDEEGRGGGEWIGDAYGTCDLSDGLRGKFSNCWARLETDKLRRFRPARGKISGRWCDTSRGFLSSLDCQCDLFACLHVTDLSGVFGKHG